MNTNKKGFTLIELLVVIVIIGILATISVATFGGYFKKARDSERQSAVQNIATIMKVVNATEETTDYSVPATVAPDPVNNTNTKGALDVILSKQGYKAPDSKNKFCYFYGYLTATPHKDFFIAVGSEEKADGTNNTSFTAGTPDAITAIASLLDEIGTADSDTNCVNGNGQTIAPAGYTKFSW